MYSDSNPVTDTVINGLFCRVRGSGTPLLMIHGIISDSTFFEECAVFLSHFYTVITYDRRSYGKSRENHFDDYSVQTQAEDAVSILTALCSTPAYILGNSAGGLIGLALSISHPALVRGLLMIEPSLGYEPAEQEKLRAWNDTLNRYAAAGQYKQVLPEFTRITGGSTGNTAFSMAQMKQTYQNLTAFLQGELNEVQHYLPDSALVSNLSVPAALAVTERGRESIFATSTITAADYTGLPLFHLPGYHNMVREFPPDAAAAIHGIFSGMEKHLW